MAAVSDSYANSNVTFGANAQWYTGGGAGFLAVGDVGGQAFTLERVYAAGSVTASAGGLTSFADLVANASADSTIRASFADDNISAEDLIQIFDPTPTTGTDITDSVVHTSTDMKLAATYTNAGWDFTNVWKITPGVNNGYPTLK